MEIEEDSKKPSKIALVKSCILFTFIFVLLTFLIELLFSGNDLDHVLYGLSYAIFLGTIPLFLLLFFYNMLLLSSYNFSRKKAWKISCKQIEAIFIVLLISVMKLIYFDEHEISFEIKDMLYHGLIDFIVIFCLIGCTFLFKKLSKKP